MTTNWESSNYTKLLAEIYKNPKQKEAVERTDHCIVIAGPGTGKTHTLACKAAKLLFEKIYAPRGLACVTYSRSMSDKLRQKLYELNVPNRRTIFVGTLHGFCLSNILIPFGQQFGYCLPNTLRIASDKQQAEYYRSLWIGTDYIRLIPDYQSQKDYRSGEWPNRLPINFQRYRRTQLDGLNSPDSNEVVQQLVDAYEKLILSEGYIDFDLQIRWAMEMVEENDYVRDSLAAKYPWILIDEYQDLGLPLHRIVKSLTTSTNMKLFAIGDQNQCIYDFSGASPDYLDELEADVEKYGSPIYLDTNYRSLPNILKAASHITPSSRNLIPARVNKNGYAQCVIEQYTVPEVIKRLNEKHGVPYEQIMVLHRYRNGCSRIIASIQQTDTSIPVSKVTEQIYDTRKPIIRWLEYCILFCTSNINQTCDQTITFNDLCDFWKILYLANDYSRREIASIQTKLRLFHALDKVKLSSDTAVRWLENLNIEIGLERLLEGYAQQRSDDFDEYITFKRALSTGGQLAGISLFEMRERILQQDKVLVDTLHSCKGQECAAVIIVDSEVLNTTQTEEQNQNKRLFYVGITRAKDWLFVFHNGRSYLANRLDTELNRR